MDWLIGLPSLVKLALIFAAMLALVRLKLNVGWALVIGAVVCGYWFGCDTFKILDSIRAASVKPTYVILVLIIMLVLILNHSLQKSRQITRIVEAFGHVSRRPRTTLVFFPALLGLLPMPGGALFSAPMVDAAGEPLGVGPRDKTLINYWFRHLWEYCWPLYPGVILTSQFAGYHIGIIMLLQFPLLLGVLAIGYFFFLRRLKLKRLDRAAPPKPPGHPLANFLVASAPVWLVIVLYAGLEGVLALAKVLVPQGSGAATALQAIPSNTMLVVSIILTTFYTWIATGMSGKSIWHVIWQKDMYQNLIIAVGIIVFGGVLEGSGAATKVAEELIRYSIPIWLVAIILPFTVGSITGITMNMVLLTYPIILTALHTQHGAEGLPLDYLAIPYCCLAFASGYAGVLITPLHICMLQSNQYFHLGATETVRPLAVPVALTIVWGAVLFLLYSALFPFFGWGPGSHLIPVIGH
jgi:hypothetical protein